LAGQQVAVSSPEEVLTEIIALSGNVDGVDLVVGAYEGFTYTVQARDTSLEMFADEIAASSTAILEAARGRLPGDEATPRVVIAEYGDKAVLVGDIGDKFTVALVGEKRVLEELAGPVERLIRRSPLLCPSCGTNLDVHTFTCPSCGKTIPFTAKACPFCGYREETRSCPSCGARLRLYVGRVEPAEAAPAAKPVEAAAPATAAAGEAGGGDTATLAALLGGATAVYFVVTVIGANISLPVALLAGSPLLAASWFTLYVMRRNSKSRG